MKFEVSAIRFPRGKLKIIRLGEIDGNHQPEAVRKAWEKWPNYLDPTQVQQGFSLRRINYERG